MLVETYSYGLCLFSVDKLTDFLATHKKSRTKRLLDLFEKNSSLYIKSLQNGVWLPIPQIDAGEYDVKLVDKAINSRFKYGSFNLEITDNMLWIADIGELLKFDKTAFQATDEIYYYTLDNEKIISAVKVAVPNGKYLVSIFGSKENNKRCFSFKLEPVSNFVSYEDSREDKYNFQIA